ncbi:MAG TPA: ATP-binding protein [Candidatus Eisenbacteria bacterium]|nr:ATP-binding protein [Candidatus Eisenbacteria bacterium]
MATDSTVRRSDAGARWLALGRMSAGLLLTGLAVLAPEAFRAPGGILAAALGAMSLAAAAWATRRWPGVLLAAFVADIGWISVSVVSAGRAEAGLGLLFALVAFAAGLCLGGRLALLVSLVAAVALVGTAKADPSFSLGSGWMFVQGLLVLALGAASHQTQAHLAAHARALDAASLALERMRIDTDTLVQELGSGLLSVDVEGSVVHLNRMGEETLGLPAVQVVGRPVEEALPEGLAPLAALVREGLVTGNRSPRSDIEIRRRDTLVPLGVGTTVLFGPENLPSGVVALFQDLTEVRRQEQLARRRDRLAAVGELAAGIAHEIRNSVLPIRGSVELLAQNTTMKPEEAKLLEVAEREADNIERFVSTLLRYTSNHAPRMTSLDLHAMATQAAEDLRLARGEALRVQVEGDCAEAWADEDQVRQALRNLVMNAADAAGPSGAITLRTGQSHGDRVWVEVEDTGPGVPAALRDRIFHPFTSGKPGGTGLGLAIVSRIIEEHEGEIELLSAPTGGARFRMTLGASRAARGMARAA